MDNNAIDREFGWDDVIEHDSADFVLLPEGDYDFTVLGFERARHGGSAKLPPCNKAVVKLGLSGPGGETTLPHNLFLHSKCEGMLCAFFTGIGQRKHGEALKMNWNAVIGARGRRKVGVRSWTKDNGDIGQSNEIKKFYEPEPPKASFKPGAF